MAATHVTVTTNNRTMSKMPLQIKEKTLKQRLPEHVVSAGSGLSLKQRTTETTFGMFLWITNSFHEVSLSVWR
jgi:hypothetical protein